MAWDIERADEAAREATQELNENIAKWSAVELAMWWRKYVSGSENRHSTGHKKLGRLLVAVAKEVEEL